MRVYLVRHGEANPKEQDPDRHLTARGLADVRKVAEFLKPLGLHVQAVWHSRKTRAAETAEEMAAAVKTDEGLYEASNLKPDDPAAPIAREVNRADADLMIVGHLPHLARLASRLVTGEESAEIVALPTAAVVCLDRDPEGGWRIAWMVTPDML